MSSPVAVIEASYPVELPDGSVMYTSGVLVICDDGKVHALNPQPEDPKKPWLALPAVPGTTAALAVAPS